MANSTVITRLFRGGAHIEQAWAQHRFPAESQDHFKPGPLKFRRDHFHPANAHMRLFAIANPRAGGDLAAWP